MTEERPASDLRPPWSGSMDDNHHPWCARRAAVSKGVLEESLIVVEAIKSHIDKRLWRVKGLIMNPTLTIVAAAAGLFLR